VRAGEAARWTAGLAGLLLWLALPLVFLYAPNDPCAGKPDDCRHDYIPVFELIVIPLLVLVTAYPFARFAFSLFAPPPPRSGRLWWFAARDGAGANWPVLQIFAAACLAWTISRAAFFAVEDEPVALSLYRLAFALWFVLGMFIGWLDRSRMAR
jgi:hypothetical protein